MCIVWSQMFLILTPKNTKLSDVFFFLPTLLLKNETQTSKKSSEQFLH